MPAQKNTQRSTGSSRTSPGQLGYRLRGDNTGFDPVDTYLEMGRLEGMFVRNLFTGRLRTRNPLVLLMLVGAALLALLPLAFSLIEYISGFPPTLLEGGPALLVVCTGVPGLVGLLMLVNLILSLVDLFR